MNKRICEIRESPIHGSGVFALRDIREGVSLFETHFKDPDPLSWVNIKPNCLYNHSEVKANCVSKTDGHRKVLVAARGIKKGEELLVDYTKDSDLEQPADGWEK